MDARATYTAGIDARTRALEALKRRSSALAVARLAIAAAVLLLLGGLVWGHWGHATWGALVALVVAFAGLVVWHARLAAAEERMLAARRFHERGLARLDERWSTFPQTGERFLRELGELHPFAADLDVFGPASLFQLLDATSTRGGEERLASWLAGTAPAPSWPAGLVERQEAVRDLAARVDFRERLAMLGAIQGAQKPDPAPLLAWAEGASALPTSAALRWVARILPVITVALFVFGADLGAPRGLWVAPLVVSIAIQAFLRGAVGPVIAAASSHEGGVVRYAEMLAALENERFDGGRLGRLHAQLRATGVEATREVAALARIVGFLDARENEVFRIFIAPVLMWDLNCALALDRWRARGGKAIRGWLEALAEVEALASLAGFAFERPDHVWPELRDPPWFEADDLAHPLLPAGKRIGNDVRLGGGGRGLVVTGSNMSGKSTLLRAMGVNAVLAAAGAPVCARRLAIGPVAVMTSLRVSDSLEHGVSHFYAELKKLKAVADRARTAPVFFLLDEILHGTNSRERVIGARAVVRELLTRGALGAVSTHDFAIAELERDLPGQVDNVHFEEQVVGDTMTFDYKLRPGVVQSSNALRLMRLVGLDFVPADPPPVG